MIPYFFFTILAGSTLILGAGMLFVFFNRRSTAANRFRIYAISVFAVLILPPTVFLTPKMGAFSPPENPSVPAVPFELSPESTPGPFLSEIPTIAATTVSESDAVVAEKKDAFPIMELATLWGAGSFLCMLHLLYSFFLSRNWIRGSRRSEPYEETVRQFARRSSRNSGARTNVQVAISETIPVPMVVGIFRPMIVLPSSAEQWTASQLKSVLLHEWTHLCRNDLIWQLLTKLACAAYWFHPMIWRIRNRMRQEREIACDDAVLRAGEKGSDYAETLLMIVAQSRERLHRFRSAVSVVAMSQTHQIETRINTILDPESNRTPLRKWSTFLLFSATIALLISAAALLPDPRGIACETVATTPQSDENVKEQQQKKEEQQQQQQRMERKESLSELVERRPEKNDFRQGNPSQTQSSRPSAQTPEAGNEDFEKSNPLLKEYVLADAKLTALKAELGAAKNFKPEEHPVPSLLIDEAVQQDPEHKNLLRTKRELAARILTQSKNLSPTDPSFLANQEKLRELDTELNSLEKRLYTEKQKELADRTKLEVQRDLWQKQANIKSQEILVNVYKNEMMKMRNLADSRAWEQALFNEQLKLVRLKSELSVMKKELEEKLEYSDEEIDTFLQQDPIAVQWVRKMNESVEKTDPQSRPGIEDLWSAQRTYAVSRMESTRKSSLQTAIREQQRAVRVCETMVEELQRR